MQSLGIGLLCAALSVAACVGGDDSDSLPDEVESFTTTVPPEGRSLADWQEASRATCTEHAPRLLVAIAELRAQTTVEGTIAEALQILQLELEHIERLRSIPTPAERTKQIERLNDQLDRAAQGVEAQRQRIESGDYDSVNSFLGVLTNYANPNELYLSLDVPECAPGAG